VYVALVVLHVLVSLAIIAIVLLQAGKGADIGSAFGGAGGSQAVFGSMGTPTILGKITSTVAVIFMLTSFTLALLSSQHASVVPSSGPAPAPPAASAPAPPGASAPATPAAPADPAASGAPATPAPK
jgi:preprotein translocase subunit SecG